ncbi:MAG: glycine oxidase ThiO [Acidobacteria bacterium]|nr:MAG: glycine oxidase ThiO [Acidobacteriota bacterium]
MARDAGPKVLLIGGGIIGCSLARELAGAGCRVTLLERDRVGSEASSAAAGILCAQLDAESPSPLLELGMESFRLFADFAAGVWKESGIDPEMDPAGTLVLDLTREDEAASRRLLQWQQQAGLPVERLSAKEIAGVEAGLSDNILGGLFFPRSGRVNPVALTRALAVAARGRGAEIREGCPVVSLRESGDRVAGVVLAGGEVLEADLVVIASGAWSSALLGRVGVAVIPVRGQMLVFEARRRPRRHVLVTPRAYLVFRRDGTVLAGSTLERAGFQKAVTPKAVMKLTASALALDPTLEGADFAGSWSGLRPGTSDGLPLLGPVRPGLLAATGHYRNGILLAPVTAALLAEWILRGKTSHSLEPFSPHRQPSFPAAEEVS